MSKYVLKPHPVVNPKSLMTHDGRPWCEDHGDYFDDCGCPKPWSTAESDEWHIIDGIAYPTLELYVGTSMWIESDSNRIICQRCNQHIEKSLSFTDQDIDDMAEAFFNIHENCEDLDDKHVAEMIRDIIV